jgi:NAD-dependent dihydropyrimidine dehydrogenase PreA subunit
VVAHPYECVVYCEACAKICPQGAISFPPKKEIVALVKELRMKHAV